MKTFLAKTDPQSYSIEDFENEKVTLWDGVHNYQAINSIKNWQIGDVILIYQSMGKNDIASIGKVIDNPFLNTNDTRYSFACQIEHLVTIPLEQRINLK
jgi:predicted RNA-binding protein with PUA-like domain